MDVAKIILIFLYLKGQIIMLHQEQVPLFWSHTWNPLSPLVPLLNQVPYAQIICEVTNQFYFELFQGSKHAVYFRIYGHSADCYNTHPCRHDTAYRLAAWL